MKMLFAGLAVLISVLAPGVLLGQSAYPARSVKFIVPFPAGGINDILTWLIELAAQ